MVLLTPTHSAMRRMLRICEDFAKDFCVMFNPTKSMCMFTAYWPRVVRVRFHLCVLHNNNNDNKQTYQRRTINEIVTKAPVATQKPNLTLIQVHFQ